MAEAESREGRFEGLVGSLELSTDPADDQTYHGVFHTHDDPVFLRLSGGPPASVHSGPEQEQPFDNAQEQELPVDNAQEQEPPVQDVQQQANQNNRLIEIDISRPSAQQDQETPAGWIGVPSISHYPTRYWHSNPGGRVRQYYRFLFGDGSQLQKFCAILIGIIPVIIIQCISHFRKGHSTKAQRVWTMTWLAFGTILGPSFLHKGDIVETGVLGDLLIGAPAVGGFVVVAQMLNEYGRCIRFD